MPNRRRSQPAEVPAGLHCHIGSNPATSETAGSAKTAPFAGVSGWFYRLNPETRLVGWGGSGDRTGLCSHSLQTGIFEGILLDLARL
jgi:hypothetical protein